MMFGVNIFSVMLCFVTLIEEGTFLSPFRFLATHEGFGRDIFLLSLSGALGQVRLNLVSSRKAKENGRIISSYFLYLNIFLRIENKRISFQLKFVLL